MHLHRLVGYHLVVVILGVLSVNNAFASSSAPNRQQSKPLSPVIFGKSQFYLLSMFQTLLAIACFSCIA